MWRPQIFAGRIEFSGGVATLNKGVILPASSPSSGRSYCTLGDGQWMLPRHFGDVFFSAHRSTDDCPTTSESFDTGFCPPPLPYNSSRDSTSIYAYPDCLFHVHLQRYGLVGSDKVPECIDNFKFWFVRPRKAWDVLRE
eukprot:1177829-Prorocentrum_minimum.AAC.1